MKFSEVLNREKVMEGSGPIHSRDISDTVKILANLVEIFPEELMDSLLGSAGKQEVSGDIDIAIEDSLENIVEVLKRNNANFKINKGLNCVHVLLEIRGPKRNVPSYTGKVQADLFFGEKEWLKFSHFSAGNKSKYKGMYRTILLSSIISATTDFADFDAHGNLIAKIGPIFNLSEGIRTQYRIAPMKKKGVGYIKKMIEVLPNNEEFIHRYGTVETKCVDISDPAEAAKFIFGSGISERSCNVKDLRSFEQVLKLMHENFPIKKQKVIQTIFRNRTGIMLPINEAQSTQMPWNQNPNIGWWMEQETITFYHGTHKDNLESIMKSGLTVSDTGRTAGINYLALDPYTGRGYGAMSGETEFRAAGKKAKHIPIEDRVTLVFEFPISYVMQNMNWNAPKLNDKELYDRFIGNDHQYYELTEVRHPGDIPLQFLIGYM